jgi:glucan endo-1,3-alpha-glucosidase
MRMSHMPNLTNLQLSLTICVSRYAAAQATGSSFKLFFSFDMSVFPCSTPGHAAVLRKWVKTYSEHPSQLRVDGAPFVSTFAGEACTFGQGSAAAGWASQFKRHADFGGGSGVTFVPSFFVDPVIYPSVFGGVLDGAFAVSSDCTTLYG